MRVLYLSILSFCFVIVACETESNQQKYGYNIEINQQVLSDSSIVKYYQPFKKNLEESLMNTPISYSPETYKKNDGELNSTLSNMFADATYEMSNPVFNKMSGENIDIVLLNNGGIRSIISKGNISEKTAFELMPFENSIVVLELNGLSIIKMIDYLKKVKLQHPISGLQITLNNDYSVNEVLDDMTKAIFVGDENNKVSSVRRNLQTSYVRRLINLLAQDYYDELATAAAYDSLRQIQKLVRKTSTDIPTRSHRKLISWIIESGLDRAN